MQYATCRLALSELRSQAMLFIPLYLCLLFVAPQLWIEPFVGLRPDLVLYPVWIAWVVASGRGGELLRLRTQDRVFLAFLFWLSISALVNPMSDRTGEVLYDYAKWFLLFRLVVVTLDGVSQIKATLVLLLFFGTLLAIEGIQHMRDPDGVGWAGQTFAWMDEQAKAAGMAGRTRWINIFDGPGVFCVVYTIALPIAMQFSMRPFGNALRFAGIFTTLTLLVATYFTGSRGGFLATVGVIGLFVLMRLKLSLIRLTIAVAVMLLALTVAPNHLTTVRDSNRSAQYRIQMWAEGVEMVKYNPLFGIGRGNFAKYTSRLIAHNSGIEIMGETGMPGLFLWLGMIYVAFANIFAAQRAIPDPRTHAYLTGLALSIAGYLLSSLFVTLEYELFYFLLAVAAAAGRQASMGTAFGKREVLTVGGLTVAYYLIVKIVVMVY